MNDHELWPPSSDPRAWDPASIPRHALTDVSVVGEGLRRPEGPVAMPDGSVLVAEMGGGSIARVAPDGTVSVISETGGSPNGAAIGPDGALYVCNNGGPWGPSWTGGWVGRVDLSTGEHTVLHAEVDGRSLSGPNDLVFDASGNFWFTDLGKWQGRSRDLGSVYYASSTGDSIVEALHPLEMPNGIGLSPDGTVGYFAETITARLWSFDAASAAGHDDRAPERFGPPAGLALLFGLPGHQRFDSLAVDAQGNICIATLVTGVITVVSPDGQRVVQLTLPEELHDPLTTNLCFGGPNLETAYVTLTTKGLLVSIPWPVPGLALSY
jgi:gluconolactonase